MKSNFLSVRVTGEFFSDVLQFQGVSPLSRIAVDVTDSGVTSSRRLRVEPLISNCPPDNVTARSIAYLRTKMAKLREDGKCLAIKIIACSISYLDGSSLCVGLLGQEPKRYGDDASLKMFPSDMASHSLLSARVC